MAQKDRLLIVVLNPAGVMKKKLKIFRTLFYSLVTNILFGKLILDPYTLAVEKLTLAELIDFFSLSSDNFSALRLLYSQRKKGPLFSLRYLLSCLLITKGFLPTVKKMVVSGFSFIWISSLGDEFFEQNKSIHELRSFLNSDVAKKKGPTFCPFVILPESVRHNFFFSYPKVSIFSNSRDNNLSEEDFYFMDPGAKEVIELMISRVEYLIDEKIRS